VVRNQGGLPPAWLRPYALQADAVIGDGWDAEHYARAIGRDLIEIPGGVDTELFRPVESDARERLDLAGREVILYVGRFVPLKNLPMLIEAFAAVRRSRPRAALVLVGEGALHGSARTRVQRLGLQSDVRFLGQQPQARLPELYSVADVVVLTSTFDNSPNTILEAGACERAVVATRVGGVPRYVEPGVNGLLVRSEDAEAFARAIGQVLDDPDLRARLGRAGRQRVLERHSWRKSAEKLINLYESLLATPAWSRG
jgi:glycosyltransferase involved in cell wall biosynthesis